jgi:hypothetical protein
MQLQDRTSQLNKLLGLSMAEIEIPDSVYELTVVRYTNTGNWLRTHWARSGVGGDIYPQGSFPLGTATRPIKPGDHYDIDLVIRRDHPAGSISKADLKDEVGLGLDAYVRTGPEGHPILSPGKRCWTFDYPVVGGDGFHMDWLPAVPDPDHQPNGILITDREMFAWQRSSPVDFAAWFRQRMRDELVLAREKIAKEMNVVDVPEWKLKTTLQRTVQALKRHRDLHFATTPADRPASIIITTLAAMAYKPGADFYEVLVDVTSRMASFVENRAGVLWVANPVHKGENFADRWANHPSRTQAFFDWLAAAQRDFARLGSDLGVDKILEGVQKSFGERVARETGRAYGRGMGGALLGGTLGITPVSGILRTTTARHNPPHTNHGDHPGTPSS